MRTVSTDEAAPTREDRLSPEAVREALLRAYPKKARRKREKQVVVNDKSAADGGAVVPEIGANILPKYVVTGTPGKQFLRSMGNVLNDRRHETKVRQGPQADMFLMHQWIKSAPVDLLIGNTYGKYIAREEDIPFVRHGFPILDRIGHQHFPTVGYRGAVRLLEQILNALMDRQDRDAPEESFELVM